MTIPMGAGLAAMDDEELVEDDAPEADDGETLPIMAVSDVLGGGDDAVLARKRRAIETLYGGHCPLVLDDPQDTDWAAWAETLWTSRQNFMQPILHRAERMRLFRAGQQWISAKGMSPWREPPRPKDTIRRVVNMIGPALDWRLQVLSEQRPGVRAKPRTMDPDDVRRATASNQVLEAAYYSQKFQQVIKEAAYWAQTDGVAFVRTYWDADRGPVDPEFGGPLGDHASRVYRIEQVRVSSNATALEAPIWWVLREVLPKSEAVARYGWQVADEGLSSIPDHMGLSSKLNGTRALETDIYNGASSLINDEETVDRYTVFLEPNPRFLPRGLEVVVVGQKVVSLGDLPIGMVPMARVADGSSDPAFFPVPICESWIDDQMALNAIESKIIENIRRNSGGRVMAKAQALVSETLRGGNDSVIEVRAPGSLGDVIQPLQGFSVGADVKEA